MGATQTGRQDGNGTSAGFPVMPDRWYNFRAWDTAGSASVDFDAGNVSLEELVDLANDHREPVRGSDGDTKTLTKSGGFQVCPAGSQLRVVLAGGGGDEDVTFLLGRVQE